MQARASGARHIVEFGTSYGISTLFLAAISPMPAWPTASNCARATPGKPWPMWPPTWILSCSTAGPIGFGRYLVVDDVEGYAPAMRDYLDYYATRPTAMFPNGPGGGKRFLFPDFPDRSASVGGPNNKEALYSAGPDGRKRFPFSGFRNGALRDGWPWFWMWKRFGFSGL